MITKERSQKIKRLKYLLIVPLLLGMLIYSSCAEEKKDKLIGIESVVNNIGDYPQYKYYNFKEGKTYIGQSILIGEYLPIEEYTETEKEMHDKINNPDKMSIYYLVIINYEGERVNFLNTTDRSKIVESSKVFEKGEDVPFAIIEEVPVFPDCEGTKAQLRKCLQDKITNHVNSTFNADLAGELNLSPGVKRISVLFKIDKEGNIAEVQARAPHKELQEEAIRVVNALPKMIPGKQKGKPVGVKYSLPIAFKVK